MGRINGRRGERIFLWKFVDICVTVTVEGVLKVVSICEKRESSESDKCELFVGSTCTSTQTSHTEDKEYFEFFYSLKIWIIHAKIVMKSAI